MNLAVINEDFIKSYFMFKGMSYNLQNGCALIKISTLEL